MLIASCRRSAAPAWRRAAPAGALVTLRRFDTARRALALAPSCSLLAVAAPRCVRGAALRSAPAAPQPPAVVETPAEMAGERPVALGCRALWLALLFLPALLASPLALLSDELCDAWLSLLVRTLACAGPCAIKLGQWASTRPDIFPPRVCHALAQLHESVPPHPAALTRAACERAFGPGTTDSLCADGITLGPVLGSGCIAQVHAGELADGTPVVIKVLHPSVARVCALDLALLRAAVRAFESLTRRLDTRWLAAELAVGQFELFMLQQLDLRREAANLERFARNFEHVEPDDAVRIVFPRPIPGLVASEVLVETRVGGQSLSRLLLQGAAEARRAGAGGGGRRRGGEGVALAPGDEARTPARRPSPAAAPAAAPLGPADALDGAAGAAGGAAALTDEKKRQIARAGLRAFLQMILVHNFVHADLHPGNIMCDLDAAADAHERPPAGSGARAAATATGGGGGGARGQVTLGFVDAGLTVELSARDRRNFIALFEAIARGDGMRAGLLMVDNARETACERPDVFAAEVSELVRQARASERGHFNLQHVELGGLLSRVLTAVREHRVMIEPNYTTLIASIGVLEGLGRQLDPTLDIFTLALPMLGRLAISEAFGGAAARRSPAQPSHNAGASAQPAPTPFSS